MKTLMVAVLLALPMFSADAKQSLLDADIAFDKSTLERGLDGWMSWFADDAQLNTPNGELKGKAALRDVLFQNVRAPRVFHPLETTARRGC